MTKKILFGNNISQISKRLAKCFKSLDFSVTRCENNKDIILEMLKNDDYDALIFFAPNENNELRSFIQNLHKQAANLKIYCFFYFNLEHNKINAIHSGESKYFTTNADVNLVCFEILKDLLDEKSTVFSLEIAEFLVKHNFPCYLNCFYLVCLSMQNLLENPDNFSNFSKYLYPFVVDKLNTTYYWAERGIRYMSKTIYKSGVCFDCYPKDSVLENKVLLRALITEFLKYKGVDTGKKVLK